MGRRVRPVHGARPGAGRRYSSESVGWRGIFWANIPVGLAAVSLTALFVPDSRAPRPRRAGPGGTVPHHRHARLPRLRDHRGSRSSAGAPRRSSVSSRCRWPRSRSCSPTEPRRAEPMVDFRFFRSVPFAGANPQRGLRDRRDGPASCSLSTLVPAGRAGPVRAAGWPEPSCRSLPWSWRWCAPVAGRMVAKRGPRIPAGPHRGRRADHQAAPLLSRLTGTTRARLL